MTVLSRFAAFTRRHPVIRGMLSYATIWPTSCIIQQTVAGKRWHNYDWEEVARFSLFGGLVTAPTLYGWIRISTLMWPEITVVTALKKAAIEQVTYGPAAVALFFFGMSLLKNSTVDEAVDEVKNKFWPTYQVAVCFWPIAQTFNFLLIPERNRVPFVSVCSLFWCCFLAYMHELQTNEKEQLKLKQILNIIRC